VLGWAALGARDKPLRRRVMYTCLASCATQLNGGQKTRQERARPPTFTMLIEMLAVNRQVAGGGGTAGGCVPDCSLSRARACVACACVQPSYCRCAHTPTPPQVARAPQRGRKRGPAAGCEKRGTRVEARRRRGLARPARHGDARVRHGRPHGRRAALDRQPGERGGHHLVGRRLARQLGGRDSTVFYLNHRCVK
jgi:hypothetical protein